MNAKRCKKLRKLARALAKKEGWPERSYLGQIHKVRRLVIERDPDTGLPKAGALPELRLVERITVRNNPQSFRGVYRYMKSGNANG